MGGIIPECPGDFVGIRTQNVRFTGLDRKWLAHGQNGANGP